MSMYPIVYQHGDFEVTRVRRQKYALWRWLPGDSTWCFFGFYRTKKSAIADIHLSE